MQFQRPVRLAYVASHPIQYQAPLLRAVAADPDIEFKAYFMSDFSLQAYRDEKFGTEVKWDVPLVEGYDYEVIPRMGEGGSATNFKPLVYGYRAIYDAQPDFLWTHGYQHYAQVWLLRNAERYGVKTLVRSDIRPGTEKRGRLTGGLKDKIVRAVFRRAHAFLAVGKLNGEYYQNMGVDPARIHLMRYAVDNERFQRLAQEAAPHRESLRAELGLEPGRPIILTASKLYPLKRVDDLIEAFGRMRGDSPCPYLLVIGSGESETELKAQAAGFGDDVRFLGFKNQSELPAYFDLCDLYVMTSGKDAFGLVINEVMNAGRPVIVSDGCGCWPDLIEPGVNGFVYRTGDIDELTARMREVLASPETVERMGAASLRLVNESGFDQNVAVLRQVMAELRPDLVQS